MNLSIKELWWNGKQYNNYMIRNDYLITRWVFCNQRKYINKKKLFYHINQGSEQKQIRKQQKIYEEGKSAEWWKTNKKLYKFLYLL